MVNVFSSRINGVSKTTYLLLEGDGEDAKYWEELLV